MAEARESREQRPSKPDTPLDLLGTTLRQAYDADAAEPLPEAFEDLLRQLR